MINCGEVTRQRKGVWVLRGYNCGKVTRKTNCLFPDPCSFPWLPRWHSDRCRKMQEIWVKKIAWRRAWQPTPVVLPGKSHGQRSLAGSSPWGCKTVILDLVSNNKWGHQVCYYGKRTPLNENLLPAFWQKGFKQRTVPMCAVSHLPSGQKDPYSKLAYFGVAYSKSLQLH